MRALLIATMLLLSLTALAQPSGAPYRMIVHPKNAAASVERDFVADAFLKKVTRWPSGAAIRPVDLDGKSHTRQKFVEIVLQRSMSAVRSYWQQQIFSGRNIPPPELDSDEAVIAFVLKYEGAIGYVSADCKVDAVKVVTVR